MISGTFYTLQEAASLLRKDRHTVSRWIKEGKLPARRVGNLVLIRKQDVQRAERAADTARQKVLRRPVKEVGGAA